MTGQNAAVRRRILMLLLYVPGPRGNKAEPIRGVTRLQKLLFLVTRETDMERQFGAAYEFEPFRFGPYSPELHDDVSYLENAGIIDSDELSGPQIAVSDVGQIQLPAALVREAHRRAPVPDVAERRRDFADLVSEVPAASMGSEFEERVYELTEYGIQKVEETLDNLDNAVGKNMYESLQRIKVQYGGVALRSLLKDVYTRYEDMTTDSEIKHLF